MASTASAVLLVLAGVFAPLGLYETIVPGEPGSVEFQYVKDPGPWGRVTMPRPNFKYSRLCEVGLIINCPGQYQGVYMNETSPGIVQSVETDETSTVNLTVPRNYTAMFASATSGRGNTVSGLFDIQYRRWKIRRWGVYDKGQPFVEGDFRYIENLVMQDAVPLLKEGLIIDMSGTQELGSEITRSQLGCSMAEPGLSVELQVEDPMDELSDTHTFFIVDRGAFVGLDHTVLESAPWFDNQTLDLFGRAQKATRMHNVLVASSLNVSLPLNLATKTLPKFQVKETDLAGPGIFNINFDMHLLQEIGGLGGLPPEIPEYSVGNTSVPGVPNFVNYYPNDTVKLLALNYSAITQICRGYYEVARFDNDRRANNITYPAVQCGYLLGAPNATSTNPSASGYSGVVDIKQRDLYVCASAIRASIKTVDFRYNGTGGLFQNLKVSRIKDKVYPDEESKPLWAVEHSYDRKMRFDPLWGMVDQRYEKTDGFYSLRAEKLWLPTSPFLALSFGETEGRDALAAVSGFIRRLGNLYSGSSTGERDYTGKYEYALLERFQELSTGEAKASQIPSLILTDGLAGSLVGTKTSISSKYVSWPASLAVDDTVRGFPRARVIRYKRVIRYDIRYAIPGFVVLALFLVALVGASVVLLSSRSLIRTIQNMFNQTSTGRLATNILLPDRSKAKQPSCTWVRKDGGLQVSFGHISGPEEDHFCRVVDAEPESEGGGGHVLTLESPTESSST